MRSTKPARSNNARFANDTCVSPPLLSFFCSSAGAAYLGIHRRFNRIGPPVSAITPPDKSIAVLPFVDLSQAKDQEYFCDGMSEEILGALAKTDGLRVVARTSSFSFKGRNVDASEIGRALNVSTILEGTLRRDGNRIRIFAQLINARDGYELWSNTYEVRCRECSRCRTRSRARSSML